MQLIQIGLSCGSRVSDFAVIRWFRRTRGADKVDDCDNDRYATQDSQANTVSAKR